MTEPTQTELRTWARAQGMTVKDRGSLPLAVRQAYLDAHADSTPVQALAVGTEDVEVPVPDVPVVAAAPALEAPHDLAGALHAYLASVQAEVTAVSSLSDQIDARVAELNELREEQAVRLLTLDALRESVSDPSLSAFLSKVIRPRPARVEEIIPERLGS